MLFVLIQRASQDLFAFMTQFLQDNTGLSSGTVTGMLTAMWVGALSLFLLKFFLGPKKRTVPKLPPQEPRPSYVVGFEF
jgi:hypothetical protein